MTYLSSFSPLQKLAAKWRLIGLLAVAFAQLMRRYEGGCVHGAYAQAEQLEVYVRAAQIALVKEVSEVLETAAPKNAADEAALAHLRVIAGCLLAVAMVLESVKQRLLGHAIWQIAPAFRPATERARNITGAAHTHPILDPG